MAQADGEERLLGVEQCRDRRPDGGDLGVAPARAGRPGRGRRPRGRRRRSTPSAVVSWRHDRRCVMPRTPRTWRSMFTKSSSPSRIDDLLAGQRASGTGAGLVGQPERREPLVARVEREQHVLGRRPGRRVRRRDGGARRRARTRTGCRRPWRASRRPRSPGRSRAPASRPRSPCSATVEADVGGADDDRAVDATAPRRGRGRSAPARRRSSRDRRYSYRVDQPAGVLDRAAGDRGGEHRVAQHLARVAAGAPGRRYSVCIRWVIGLRNGPSTWPPSWQMSHIILSSSSTTMKSS